MVSSGDELQRLVEDSLDGIRDDPRGRPGAPAQEAWGAFLTAHASLMRVLDAELEANARVSLSDFDVLIQLGLADGTRLRMSELARRVLISRSGMTRRAGRLEKRGLVARQPDPADRRSVVLTLTGDGAATLRRAVPVHFRGVNAHFFDRLTPEELSQLQAALAKVTVKCDFG